MARNTHNPARRSISTAFVHCRPPRPSGRDAAAGYAISDCLTEGFTAVGIALDTRLLSLSLSLSLTHTHTHTRARTLTHSLSLSHSLTHTHTHTHTRCHNRVSLLHWPGRSHCCCAPQASRKLNATETNSAATLRIAQSWLGQLVAAATKARPGIKPYMYSEWAKFGHGFQLNSWQMLRQIGYADEPS